GRKRRASRTQGHARPIGVVAGLPQLRALLGDVRPLERAAAKLAYDLAEGLGLLLHAGIAAVELDEKAWRFGVVELRIGIERTHAECVDQLDSRHRNAHLDRGDDRLACRVDVRERADAARNRLRDAVELEGER